MGFDVERDELIRKLNDLQTLKEITKLMISKGFLDEFYEILNKEREDILSFTSMLFPQFFFSPVFTF
ncbi:DUF1473 family protein [Borrelia maritima]|uniref:DUF1473 family protein n=1 Tax=Borrelia TaxID=138 RepID=UPI00225E20B0|nr:DUF1473 family protein [Borrelia maritima]WKC83991.1 DUF1473 family protein [Borrelia sp. CA_690]